MRPDQQIRDRDLLLLTENQDQEQYTKKKNKKTKVETDIDVQVSWLHFHLLGFYNTTSILKQILVVIMVWLTKSIKMHIVLKLQENSPIFLTYFLMGMYYVLFPSSCLIFFYFWILYYILKSSICNENIVKFSIRSTSLSTLQKLKNCPLT